ncbi:MAG: DUF1934 domain-containing protein [Clostridia bacterium]|nr:DUF1934 domain-containing protein [Clostridia bacterium]
MKGFSGAVRLHFTTSQRADGEKSVFEKKYSGRMFCKDGTVHVFYKEPQEEGEPGADCVLSVQGGKVIINRKGRYASRLIYEPGRTFKSLYNTPYGCMPIIIKPHRVTAAVDEAGGKIILEYTLSLSGQCFENNVIIRITRPE